MFADDTTISSVNMTVSTWADNNRMSLNTTKTKSLLITTLQKRRTLTSSALNVQINGGFIEQVKPGPHQRHKHKQHTQTQ